MSSVTNRVTEVKQPRGGYVKPSTFAKTVYDDGNHLEENENIHPSIVGMVVDYMTRFLITTDVENAFNISIDGYCMRMELLGNSISAEDVKKSGILKRNKRTTIEEAKRLFIITKDGENGAFSLLEQIKGLDDNSIIAACKIVTYDIWYRNPMIAMGAKNAEDTNPDKQTINNIRILIQRCLLFLEAFGPVIAEDFVFAEENKKGIVVKSGYTPTVDSGDGDYLTSDTMWDFKVSRSKLTSKQTLQLLMYYIMGKHSGMDIYKNIKKLGFFNPRLNVMHILNVDDIPEEAIKNVEKEVICY